jgi:hypothetical protein
MVSKPLTASAILDAADLPTKSIDVPEWGGVLHYRAVSLQELASWEEQVNANDKIKVVEMMSRMLVIACCDSTGSPIFLQADDWKKLAGKSAKVIKRIYEAVCAHNGIGDAGRKVAAGNSSSPASDSD